VTVLAVALVLTSFGASCAGDDSSNGTDQQTPTVAQPRTPLTVAPKTPTPDGTITITQRNLQFDTDQLFAPAGELTIVLVNDDLGTPHNIHFFRGSNARGETVDATPLSNGPATDTLELDLDAGDYFFQCDVHPNMKGTLTVT
jgi:plastocyanin